MTSNTTHVTTRNPVRSDLASTTVPAPRDGDATTAPRTRSPRLWAVAGVVAGVAGIVGGAFGAVAGTVYDTDLVGDEAGSLADMSTHVTALTGFHVATTISLLAIVVFGLGLARRLRAALPGDSLLPGLAAFGLLGTSVVQVLATGLDTEFIFGLNNPETVNPSAAIFYGHWVNTIPGCLVLTGLSSLAVFAAARRGAAPRWLGVVGLVLGGLSLLAAVAPLQYMAGATGGLWIVITAIGFLVGDKAFRAQGESR